MKNASTLFFRFPGIIWVCVVLSVMIYAPSLDSGFQADDYHIIAMQKGLSPFPAVEWNLTHFIVFGLTRPGMAKKYIEEGVIPWWSSHDLWIKTFRPLAGFLMSLDYHLFGDSPLPYHVHSLLWGILLFLSFGLLLRRVLPGRFGAVALAIYTLSTIPSVPILWIVNRYALIACALAVLGLLAHIRWREDGWKPGLPLSILGIAVGLAAGEIAFSVLAFFFAYELAAAPGGIRQRCRAVAPILLVIAGYLIVYTVYGFGASGSGLYFDRSGPPAEYAKTAFSHLGVLLGRSYGGIPADVTLAQQMLIPVSILGYGFFAAALLLARPFFSAQTPEMKRKLAWFGLGSILSLGPVLLALPMDRLLVGSFLGGSVVLSFLLVNTWDCIRSRAGHGRTRRFGYLLVVGYLVFWNFIVSPALIGFQIVGRKEGSRKTLEAVRNADLPDEEEVGREVVVFHAPGRPGQIVTWYLIAILDYLGRPVPRHWRVLTIAPCDHSLMRTDSRSLELACLNGKMLATIPEKLFRSSSLPLRPGDVVEAGVMTVEILETTDVYPTKVRFRFAKELDSRDFLFLDWKDGTLRKTRVPEIGETRILKAEEPGFWRRKMETFLKGRWKRS